MTNNETEKKVAIVAGAVVGGAILGVLTFGIGTAIAGGVVAGSKVAHECHKATQQSSSSGPFDAKIIQKDALREAIEVDTTIRTYEHVKGASDEGCNVM